MERLAGLDVDGGAVVSSLSKRNKARMGILCRNRVVNRGKVSRNRESQLGTCGGRRRFSAPLCRRFGFGVQKEAKRNVKRGLQGRRHLRSKIKVSHGGATAGIWAAVAGLNDVVTPGGAW